VVQSGDTLNSLAARTNTTVFELQRVNCLDTFSLQVGQTLYLPFVPSTPTVTETPTPTSTPTATRERPQIIRVSPNSGEEGTEVTIVVEGRNFRPDDPDFSVELAGSETGVILVLGALRSTTSFEAIVPSTLPVGTYDLFVVNPDDQIAIRSSAYQVVAPTPSITPEPDILFNPDQLAFDEQLVGTSSQIEIITLANTGTANLILDDIDITGPNFAEFILAHNCPTRLPPEHQCDLRVRFTPAAEGNRIASVTILSNADGSPHVLPLSGLGKLGKPDLVVTLLEITGPVFLGQEKEPNLPVRAVIKNEGDAAAPIFKIAASYTGGNIAPESEFVAAFKAESSDDVDPANGFYPFTRRELLSGEEVTFEGVVVFNPKEQGATISLKVIADSCSGEENQPAACRVEESDENNNESEPISGRLFNDVIE
jgi:hypothetical protein